MLGENKSCFGISDRLQEIMCFVGQQQVFEQGSQTLKKLLHIDISGRQIERVSEYYGKKIEQQMQV